ncbi:MAG TPA: DUF1116 domain-containing protein [Methylomirabilota bacterium]|jgi:hypothetical protein|nr:DUF1116 domain-containing protein [Methylomirabilota bacterium]
MAVNIGRANREALDRLCRARPTWTAVEPAREALGLTGRSLLHAGPPIGWDRMCSPMRGAVTAAILSEGWARTPADAERLAAAGEIGFSPCHSRGAVGPMAGVISPSTPLLVVEDPANRTTAYTFIADGPWGHQLRFGAHGPETLAGLAWIRDVVAPAFQAVLEREGPIDLASLMSQALGMGDEMHMRNAAATGLLARRLAAPLAAAVADRDRLQAILRFVTRDNDQFFLAWAMCAAKAAARAIEGLEGSTVVSTMARNGVEFGIRVAGLGDRWFTGPASVVDGLYFPGFTAEDANRDTGDSAIMETYGLGGMAMAASPAVQKIVGAKSFADAVATSRNMAEICVGANPLFPLAPLNGDGTPTGIDIRKVAQTGMVPAINTAIAHRSAHAMIGAGISTPPIEPFTDALVAFGDAYPA